MKMRLPIWILVVVAMAIIGMMENAHSEMVWDTPVGRVGLPLESTEALIGYDGIVKQSIAGASLPVWTDPRQFFALHMGAVAPWSTNGPSVEPYCALGIDLMRQIPKLEQYKSLHLNAFGRWATSSGKAGAGVSLSYSFVGDSR